MCHHASVARHPLPRRAVLGALGTAAMMGAATGTAARAQSTGAASDWPSRPVRYIEPYPPGGGTDIASRAWCAAMAEITGQTFVVENRTGAGGTIGNAAIARAAPDGTTIGLGGIGTHVIAPVTMPGLAYDPVRDFTFLSGQWRQPLMLVVNNDLPARSVAELIALLKRNPGRYQYATGGSGNSPHLSGELFKLRAELDIGHVPYRGPEVMLDLIAGRVPIAWGLFATAIPIVREGKIRALGISSRERSVAAPDIPAVAEALPGFEFTSWACVVGPAGLPRGMVERISQVAQRALAQPALVQRYQQDGSTPWLASPEEVAAYRAEQARLLEPILRAVAARAQ